MMHLVTGVYSSGSIIGHANWHAAVRQGGSRGGPRRIASASRRTGLENSVSTLKPVREIVILVPCVGAHRNLLCSLGYFGLPSLPSPSPQMLKLTSVSSDVSDGWEGGGGREIHSQGREEEICADSSRFPLFFFSFVISRARATRNFCSSPSPGDGDLDNDHEKSRIRRGKRETLSVEGNDENLFARCKSRFETRVTSFNAPDYSGIL